MYGRASASILFFVIGADDALFVSTAEGAIFMVDAKVRIECTDEERWDYCRSICYVKVSLMSYRLSIYTSSPSYDLFRGLYSKTRA